MASHGILMSDEMVRQYLAGVKTQTRRTRGLDLINEDPDAWISVPGLKGEKHLFISKFYEKRVFIRYPYGRAGDELWFRETWRITGWGEGGEFLIEYKDGTSRWVDAVDATDEEAERLWMQCSDDCEKAGVPIDSDENYRFDEAHPCPTRWHSSMFMYKWASRIVTRVTGVRVERLQDISREDAKAEGVSNVWRWHITESNPEHFKRGVLNPYIANYSVLWDKLNAKRGMSWEFNPWVWVYEFHQYNASSSPAAPLSATSGEVVG